MESAVLMSGALAPCLTTSNVKIVFESGLLFMIYPKNELNDTLITHAKTKADFIPMPKYCMLNESCSILLYIYINKDNILLKYFMYKYH